MSRQDCDSGWVDRSLVCRGLTPPRATHMAVPDKDKPVSKDDPGSIGQVIDLVKEYARQETLGPIKGAGRWLAAGAAGALLTGHRLCLPGSRRAANGAERVRQVVPRQLDDHAAVSVCVCCQPGSRGRRRVADHEEENLAERELMMAQQRITRDDLESRFRQLQDNVQGRVDDKKSTLVTVGVVGGVVLLLIFFFLGNRRGKKKTTLVEIRRV